MLIRECRIKFFGFNALLVAASHCGSFRESSKEGIKRWENLFDFLLKKGVSALETDTENGWVNVRDNVGSISLTLYLVGIYTIGCVIINQALSWNISLNVSLGIGGINRD
jgi:hypothetical protein